MDYLQHMCHIRMKYKKFEFMESIMNKYKLQLINQHQSLLYLRKLKLISNGSGW